MANPFLNFINLHNGEESKEKVLANVRSGVSFRGSNLWILACAIVVASVGLNVNSTSVIIGAMLISPLMGPIVGAGFALGTYDFELLQKSGKNLLIATVVSLTVATLYFLITPFKETQSELLARTSPTIYDVLIAFFGGLVGIIALTRVEKGNPIPGVAIATALMPPLCTAGYGLAIGNGPYFLGAFYLYIINCFFICIATVFMVKYLGYPAVASINPKTDRQIRYAILTLLFILIIPSFYLAYRLFTERQYTQKANRFITEEFVNKGFTVIYQKVRFNKTPKEIDVAFLSRKLTPDEIRHLNELLPAYSLLNTRLEIKQDSHDLKGEILQEINGQNRLLTEKEREVELLKAQLAEYRIDVLGLRREVSILFPELTDVSIGKHRVEPDSGMGETKTVFLYRYTGKQPFTESERLQKWLAEKLRSRQVEVVEKR